MTTASSIRIRAGGIATMLVLLLFGGISLWMDPVDVRHTRADPTAAPGFHGDEATYYLMAHSLAADGDLEYRAEDLARTLAEFAGGPSGVFLSRGVRLNGEPDPDPDRLFFGKSFIYPLAAAPFVRAFGTRGFHVFNAVLLAVGFLCAYLFLSARSPVTVSLVLAAGFLFPTVVPVYWAWIAPELFNCILGLVAYFLWVYKFISPSASRPSTRWLRAPISDITAGIIIGLLAFSKVTNILLVGPMAIWWIWRREWRRAFAVCGACALVTLLLFGANTAITGGWNYQAGLERSTCHGRYPFAQDGVGLEVCSPMARGGAEVSTWLAPDVFWSNLRANLGYFVVGRYSGVVAYFFPVVLGTVLLLAMGRRQREGWQWLVLASLAAQALLFIITQPYSYFGSGGSVGNRYFMGAYGIAIFLFPPVRSLTTAVIPWVVGGLFMAPHVLSPFDISMRPGDGGYAGPLRVLPAERTNYSDLPVQTERDLMLRWFGRTDQHPGFQILYLDKNAYLQEEDRLSFWTRGGARAEMFVRTNAPERELALTLTAGEVSNNVRIRLEGERAVIGLAPHESVTLRFAPRRGFVYKKWQDNSYIWLLSIKTDTGWTPADDGSSHDTRFLGVRVTPLIVP